MQLFHRLPIIKMKAFLVPKRNLFLFGTKLEDFSQAFGFGFTIFLPLIEIIFYVQPDFWDNGHTKITFVAPDNRQIKRLSKTFILRMLWMPHMR